jgi:acetolactate synthase-1/2/3 large subunit
MSRVQSEFVHVHPGAEELGRVYQGDLLINAGMPEFAAAARTLSSTRNVWDEWTEGARADYEAWQEPVPAPGALNMSEVVNILRRRLPPGAIVTNGAGNFSLWVHRFFRYSGFRTQLAPTSGAMGYGVPSAIAAKLVHPDRPVVSFSGDGCFLMNGQEIATAMQYDLKIVFVVVNNGMSAPPMHQERLSGPRKWHRLENSDFAALARASASTARSSNAPRIEPARVRLECEDRGAARLRVDPRRSRRATLSAISALRPGAKSGAYSPCILQPKILELES